MNFDDLRAFQDSLISKGIGGNDCAVYIDSKLVYRHFSGWQDMEAGIPISDRTLYRMFSMTKPITCTAALQLYEKGAFLLNDPLSDYMPEFADMKVRTRHSEGTWYERPASRPILIQNLFDMTAGFDYDLNAKPLIELFKEMDGKYTTLDYARAIAKKPLLFDPGEHWYYSQAHDVLGALIEVLSGMTLGEYFKKYIFEPLGMNESWFIPPEGEQVRYCRRYGIDPNTGRFFRDSDVNPYQLSPNMESGGAGISMTVDDYAKFACAMMGLGVSKDGARILAGRTVELMRTNRLNDQQIRDIWLTPARQGYGYGLGVRTLIDTAVGGSNAPLGEFGWAGAWGTYVIMDPQIKLTVVYAEQATDPKSPYIHRRLRNIIYSALDWEGLI